MSGGDGWEWATDRSEGLSEWSAEDRWDELVAWVEEGRRVCAGGRMVEEEPPPVPEEEEKTLLEERSV